jgi:hypothetical protein
MLRPARAFLLVTTTGYVHILPTDDLLRNKPPEKAARLSIHPDTPVFNRTSLISHVPAERKVSTTLLTSGGAVQ